MSTQTRFAYLDVQLESKEHSIADVTMVIENLHNLVVAGIWASMLNPRLNDATLIKARSILQTDVRRTKASDRFYPGFGQEILRVDRSHYSQIEIESEFSRRFDPYDPLDAGLQIGISSWVRRTIFRADPQLEKDLFSFASVSKVEHSSPLLIELSVVLGLGITLPTLLVYGLMRAVSRGEREQAEAEIRRIEAQLKQEELTQQQLRTRILEEMTNSIHELGQRDQIEIPPEVLIEAARIASPSVADLHRNPLINQLTFGVSGLGQK